MKCIKNSLLSRRTVTRRAVGRGLSTRKKCFHDYTVMSIRINTSLGRDNFLTIFYFSE